MTRWMIRDIPRLDLHWFADDTAGPACEACNDSGLETQSVLVLDRTGPGMYRIVEETTDRPCRDCRDEETPATVADDDRRAEQASDERERDWMQRAEE